MKLNCHAFFPKCCQKGCCRPNKQQRILAKSYAYVLKEASISHIIQQLRVLNAASKEMRTKEKWNELSQKYSMVAFSDINSENEVADDHIFEKATPDGESASPKRGAGDPNSKKFGAENTKK